MPGDEHPFVVNTMSTLATNLTLLGELDEAERVGKEAFRRADFVTAERIFRDGLNQRLKRTPPNLLLVANSRGKVAGALAARAMWAEAAPLYEAAIAYYRGNLSANSARIAPSLTALGDCRALEGKHSLAVQAAREAVEAAKKILGGVGRASLAGALCSLGRTKLAMGAHREAAELLQQSREMRESNSPNRDMYFGLNVSALGRALAAEGKHVEVRKFLEEGASILRTNKRAFARVEMERNRKALAGIRP